MTDDDTPELSRRSVLRNSAIAAGALATGTVAAGTAAGELTIASGVTRKRGGRAQADGDVRRNEPFTLMLSGADTRNATCMAEESAMQTYLTYDIQYCDSDDDDSDATMYVIPQEAELVETETYVIRSIQQCRVNDLQKVAFGPSPEDC